MDWNPTYVLGCGFDARTRAWSFPFLCCTYCLLADSLEDSLSICLEVVSLTVSLSLPLAVSLIVTAVSSSHRIEASLFCRYQKGESTSLPVWLNESYHTESFFESETPISVYTHVQQLSNASVVRGVVGADTNSSWLNTLLAAYHEK